MHSSLRVLPDALLDRLDLRAMARLHGGYYLVSGLWPLVSLRTFERVTGPKTDDWLVRTVGILATVIGGTLLRDGLAHDRRGGRPDVGPAAAAAVAFAGVDLVYVARRRIAPIYLFDAIAGLLLVAGWAVATAHSPGSHRRTR